MAAVKSAVKELGGLITLQTSPGQGTRFAIQLPLTLPLQMHFWSLLKRQQFAIRKLPLGSVRSGHICDHRL